MISQTLYMCRNVVILYLLLSANQTTLKPAELWGICIIINWKHRLKFYIFNKRIIDKN